VKNYHRNNFFKPFTVKGFRQFSKPPVFFWHAGWLRAGVKSKSMNQMISKTDLRTDVINNDGLSLVQFKKEWNGACQIIAPIYEELAKSYKGQANFFTIDVEKEQGVDLEFGVMEIPTILFFKGGEIIDHVTGLTPKNIMITKIENALASAFN
jgi:thioredoxin 1